jgi:hypothetical protein
VGVGTAVAAGAGVDVGGFSVGAGGGGTMAVGEAQADRIKTIAIILKGLFMVNTTAFLGYVYRRLDRVFIIIAC